MGRKVKGGKQQPQNKKTRRSGGGGEDQDGDSSDGQDRQQQQQQHLDDRMSEVTIESAPGDCNEDYEMPTTSASAATSQRLLLPAHLLSAFETLSNDSKKTSAAHRLTALNSLGNHVALSFAPNLLHSHSESVLPELIKSLRKSSSSSSSSLEECTAAAKLIALLFISGDDWIVEEEDKFHSSLLAAIRANTPSSSSSSSSSTAAMVIDTDTAAQLAACIDSLASKVRGGGRAH